MDKEIKRGLIIGRISIILSGIIATAIFWMWSLLLIRSSEFLQGGYYYFDGTMFYALGLLIVIPIIMVAYRFWKGTTLRWIILVLQIAAVISGTGITLQYLKILGMASPYSLIGWLFQDNLALITFNSMLNLSISTLSLLVIITPSQYIRVFRNPALQMQFSGGLGNEMPYDTKQAQYLFSLFGIGLIISSIMLYYIQEGGVMVIQAISLSFIILSLFLVWFSLRPIYQPKLSEILPNELIINQKGVKLYGILSGVILVLITYGFVNLPNFETISFMVLILGTFILLGFARLIWDRAYNPKSWSEFSLNRIYLKLRLGSRTFGGYGLYGGIAIFLASMLYYVDVDRQLELLAVGKLLVMTALFFALGLFMLKWVPTKILSIFIWIALVSTLYLQLEVANIALTTDWFLNSENIISGFPYHQSWAHALLCGVVIGFAFASFFQYYHQYHLQTQQHGIHFEAQFLFMITLMIFGLIIGHDHRYSGPHTSDFPKSAQNLFDLLEVLFIVSTIVLLLTLLIGSRQFVIQFQKTEKSHKARKITKRQAKYYDLTKSEGSRCNKSIYDVSHDNDLNLAMHMGGMNNE